MKPLLQEDADEFERALLGADDTEPPPGARDRAIAALGLASVPAAPDAAAAAGAAPSSGVAATSAMKWLLPLTLIVAGGAALAVARSDVAQSGAGAPAVEASPPPGEGPREAAQASDENAKSGAGTAPASDEMAPSPTVTPDALPDAPGKREAAIGAARAPEGARTPTVGRAPPPSDDALARETALVDEARRALGKDGAARALALLDEHDREFPSGVFHVDADVLRIEALERAGRAAEAERLAAQFLSRHSEGPYARRVRAVRDRVARAQTAETPAKEPVQ